MIPQINDVIDFSEENVKIIIPSKTYKLDTEDGLLYIDDYLTNITFKIQHGNLIETVKNNDTSIIFSLIDGYLIISDEEE